MREKSRGFGLLELLVAVSIIMFAVTGPLALISRSISAAQEINDNIIASFLVQEGFDLVRYHRDNNALADPVASWLRGNLNRCFNGTPCRIETSNASITNCVGACPALRYRADGLYTYTSGSPTTFVRTIDGTERVAGREAEVTVNVSWQTKSGSTRSIEATTIIMDTW